MDINVRDTQRHMEVYSNFINPYEIALERIRRRLDVFNREYALKNLHNPIHGISSRIKSLQSMADKLMHKGYELSFESARKHLTDIAGIRVICYYLTDIDTLVHKVRQFDDCLLIKEADYVSQVKPSGYRSYHVVLGVPLSIEEDESYYPVEIQLRTLAMDFWASIEHELRYKQKKLDEALLLEELKQYSETLNNMDERMERFYQSQFDKKEEK